MSYLKNSLRFCTVLLIFIVFLFSNHLYALSFRSYRLSENVRVLLKNATRLLNVDSYSPITLYDVKRQRILLKNNRSNAYRFTVDGDGIILNRKQTYCDKLRVISKNGLMKVDDQLLEGEIILIRNGSRIQVINILGVEKYLESVVSGELSDKSPLEALKAQAVASRTFTYDSMKRSVGREYDLSRYSQNYIGVCKGNFRIKDAVADTKNVIMLRKGRLFTSFFHGTCGGDTEYAGNIWKGMNYPVSVKCPYCKKAKYYKWKAAISLKKIEERLSKKGYKIGKIIQVRRYKVSRVSQRITPLKIKGTLKEITIRADTFRNIVGADKIRSTNFKMRISGDTFYLEGFGWGHGVGMCQSGAEEMATLGWRYKKILEYYYPGVQFKTI